MIPIICDELRDFKSQDLHFITFHYTTLNDTSLELSDFWPSDTETEVFGFPITIL